MLHPYAGQEYTESLGHAFVGVIDEPPAWDDDPLSHDEAHLGDFFLDQRDTQFSVGASQLHSAPGATQPT